MAKTKQQEIDDLPRWTRLLKVKYLIALILWYALLIGLIIGVFPPPWWGIWGAILAIYSIFMIEQTNQDEVAAIRLFGQGVWEIRDGGLAFAPWPIADIVRAPAVQIYLEVGTPVTGKEGAEIPPDPDREKELAKAYKVFRMKEPMRISFATPGTADYNLLIGDETDPVKRRKLLKEARERFKVEDQDPIHRRLTTDPHLILVWRIENFLIFLRRLGTITEANETIKGAGVSGFQEIAGRLTPAMAIGNQALIHEHVTDVVETRIGERNKGAATEKENGEQRYPWLGIDFSSAQVSIWGLPRRINEAQADVGKTEYRAQRLRIIGEAEKDRRTAVGQGDANARRTFLEAEAIGAGALAKATGTPEGLILQWMQVVRDGLKQAKFSIVPGSQNVLSPEGITSAGASLAEVIRLFKEMQAKTGTGTSSAA